MRIEHLFLSLIALLLSFSLIACGLIFLISPHALPSLPTLGITFLSVGIFLITLFALFSRRRYLLLEMGGAAIHERLIRYFAKEALQKLFPNQKFTCDVIVHRKGKVEILANIPYPSEQRRAQKLEEIETELAATLIKHCGCKEPFIFNVHFF